jgi:hypothetical protein
LLRPSAAWLPGSALSLRVKPETRNIFLESHRKFLSKDSWRFLTSHARVLLYISRDPGVRLRDVAPSMAITERGAHAIIADLTAAGYVVKHKHGRRNRYYIQAHLPLPKPASREPAHQVTRLPSTTLTRTDTGGPASAVAYREQSQERTPPDRPC